MIKSVTLGEEIVVTTKNKVGLLADISIILANQGINITAAAGHEDGRTARVMLITNANLGVVNELKKRRYKTVKETEVVLVDLENKPGALKVVATELANKGIDIKYHYITACSSGALARMVLQTSDNEEAMAVLSKYIM
jgi:hypothetical protein